MGEVLGLGLTHFPPLGWPDDTMDRALQFAFADPSVPAFFTLTLDRRTLRPRVLHMTAAAHFMTDRYVGFDVPVEVSPPSR